MKSPVIRQVKSMNMSCDPVGNLLLVRFAFHGGARDACVFLPASIVFWLLEHFPVNQDPTLQAPSPLPVIEQHDWDDSVNPRVFTVQCKQFRDAIRMTMQLENVKQDLMVLLDRSNVELMRQIMLAYKPSLMDLGV